MGLGLKIYIFWFILLFTSLSPCRKDQFAISYFSTSLIVLIQAPVVQKLDSAIHRINHYPADKYYGNQLRYLPDSDLSGGLRYPTFEQPGPGLQLGDPASLIGLLLWTC